MENRETVGEFIARAIPDDSYRLRIEADDMLPRKGTKSSLKDDTTMQLWFGGYEMWDDGTVRILGLFN